MSQDQEYKHPSGVLIRRQTSRRNAVQVFDQTVEVSETGRWLLGSGGVEPIFARPTIQALLTELLEHGLASQINTVYVTPLLACSLILNGDISFKALSAIQLNEAQTELSLGQLEFKGINVKIIAIRDLQERFNKGNTEIVVTDSQGAPLS